MESIVNRYSHGQLNQKEIQQFLPHRPPFLLVDRIIEISSDKPMDDENPRNKVGIKVVGIKCISMNEPQFLGHFPEVPVMPGVLLIETMAQVASFAMYPGAIKKLTEEGERFQCVLVGVDHARFRVPVVPGDVVRVEATVAGCRTFIWSFKCRAYVEGKLVAEADLMANLVPASVKRIF